MIRDQIKNDKPDLAAIKTAAGVVNEAAANQEKWFPAGSGPEAGKTQAKAEIWSKPAEFKTAMKNFADAAPQLQSAANSGDVAAIKTAFADTGKTCKGCHENVPRRRALIFSHCWYQTRPGQRHAPGRVFSKLEECSTKLIESLTGSTAAVNAHLTTQICRAHRSQPFGVFSDIAPFGIWTHIQWGSSIRLYSRLCAASFAKARYQSKFALNA